MGILNLRKSWHKLICKNRIDSRLKLRYYKNFNIWPNLNNPTKFNEKILYRMLHDRNKFYPILTDKFLVREYIAKNIGQKYLIPLIHSTENTESLLDIKDWSNTVIKPNHAAGKIRIINNNPTLTEKKIIIDEIKKWLLLDFSKTHDEWQYTNIKPMILMESKITKDNSIPRDYKFHCFKQKNEEIEFVLQLVDGRFNEESRGYYLNSFENCIWHHGIGKHHINPKEVPLLKKIIHLNEKLMSDKFKYVRIDWYIVDNMIYFGELTFTPGAGKSNEFGKELEKIMGRLWIE